MSITELSADAAELIASVDRFWDAVQPAAENFLYGSDFDDVLIAGVSGKTHVLTGLGADDVSTLGAQISVNIAGGDNTIVGGDGADSFYLSASAELLDQTIDGAGGSYDLFALSLIYRSHHLDLGALPATLTLSGIEEWGAGTRADVIFGTADDNSFLDMRGDDTFYGGSGSEVFYDADGDDSYLGGAGDDVFTDRDGADVFDGGEDFDTLRYAGYTWTGLQISYDAQGWRLEYVFDSGATFGETRLTSIEAINLYTSGDDNVTYSAGTNGFGEEWTLRNTSGGERLLRISGDSDGLWLWSTFVETYDEMTGQRTGTQTTFDTGVLQSVVLEPTTQDFITLTMEDVPDIYVWQTYVDSYVAGVLDNRVMTMDNGDLVNTDFRTDGSRESAQFVDVSDSWYYGEITDTFHDNGSRFTRRQVMDNADVVYFQWDDAGLLRVLELTDGDDDMPWEFYQTTYDSNGVTYRFIREDDGDQQQSYYWEGGGGLKSVWITDASDSEAWLVQHLEYNEAGVLISKTLEQDDNDDWVWSYDDAGVLQTFEIADGNGSEAWDLRRDVYEADGVTLDYREFHYADGSIDHIEF